MGKGCRCPCFQGKHTDALKISSLRETWNSLVNHFYLPHKTQTLVFLKSEGSFRFVTTATAVLKTFELADCA